MKYIITIIAAVLLSVSVFAQSPQKMSYQAVIRDASNALVQNSSVGMQISILQGSPTGTPVYSEMQTPTTNTNGLVSLEIGNGTVVSGNFATIDWSAGIYFIKTETDPSGGTNYSITGTSQLLSVPYALHAKTAETVTGTITESDPLFSTWDKSTGIIITESQISDLDHSTNSNETDPVFTAWDKSTGIIITESQISDNYHFTNENETDPLFTAWDKTTGITITKSQISDLNSFTNADETDQIFTSSVSSSITATNISNWNNKQDQLTAGTGIKIIGNTIKSKTYLVGDFAYGGIIYWLDETSQHGLVCAKTDQSLAVRWYGGNYGYTRAYGDGPLSGKANTSIIIATQGAFAHSTQQDDGGTYAARICNELQVTEGGITYGDWYLPSKAELNIMYVNRGIINTTAQANGGSPFVNVVYMSSTENDGFTYWIQVFDSAGNQSTNNKSITGRVRAIRSF